MEHVFNNNYFHSSEMINDMFRKMCECSGEERGLSAHNNNCFVYELWRRRRWGLGKFLIPCT